MAFGNYRDITDFGFAEKIRNQIMKTVTGQPIYLSRTEKENVECMTKDPKQYL